MINPLGQLQCQADLSLYDLMQVGNYILEVIEIKPESKYHANQS
jgi:hypothetical protein